MDKEDGRPLVLGHRGARREAPENTLPAFRRAMQAGADGVELDVHLSGDGHPVVIHDATLDRTSDGSGRVSQTPLARLRQLDAGGWFGPSFAGTGLPTLAEALEVLAAATLVNIELKGSSRPAGRLERQVLQAVQAAGMPGQVILSSFSPAPLWRLRQSGPIALGWLHGPGPAGAVGLLLARLLRLQALHPFHGALSAGYLRRAHRQGLQVNTWTVNEEAAVHRLARLGVDAIITDCPEKVRQWLQETAAGEG